VLPDEHHREPALVNGSRVDDLRSYAAMATFDVEWKRA
jgi:hypothetical protein